MNTTLETTPGHHSVEAAAVYTHRVTAVGQDSTDFTVSVICACGNKYTSMYNEELDYSSMHPDWDAEKDAHFSHAQHVASILRAVTPRPVCPHRHLAY